MILSSVVTLLLLALHPTSASAVETHKNNKLRQRSLEEAGLEQARSLYEVSPVVKMEASTVIGTFKCEKEGNTLANSTQRFDSDCTGYVYLGYVGMPVACNNECATVKKSTTSSQMTEDLKDQLSAQLDRSVAENTGAFGTSPAIQENWNKRW